MSAFSFALKKLSCRSMTTLALTKCLQEKGFSFQEIESAIEECKKIGVLNDDDWIETKLRRLKERKKSRLETLLFFQKYGFSKEKIEPLLPKEQKEILRALIEKKYSQLLEDEIDEKVKRKAMHALFRRGFSFEEIMQALK